MALSLLRAIVVCLSLLGITRMAMAAPVDVWLDVDPAAGLFERDVDDVVAMIQAFRSPEIHVRGISVVYGNAPLDKGVLIAREAVENFSPSELYVFPGAAEASGFDRKTQAVRALADELSVRPLTILALGPLTNIAALLKQHPDVHERIQSIICVAGRRPGQKFNYSPEDTFSFPDFNFENDPDAMQVLLDSDIEIVLAPWEVSSHVWIRQADLDALASSGKSGAYLAEKSKSWIGMWKRNFKFDGFNPFDTLGVVWVTHPELIESFTGSAEIKRGPNDRSGPGEASEKAYLIVNENEMSGRMVRYCYKPKPEFKVVLMERLKGDPDRHPPVN